MHKNLLPDVSPEPVSLDLTETEKERLGRLRAEAELAALRARVAEDAFKSAARIMAAATQPFV